MNPIPLLQRYLAQFLAIVLPPEDLRLGVAGTLGPATLAAIDAFLARTALVPPADLRPRSSKWNDWLIGELEAALGERRSIAGRVVDRRGNVLPGLRVAALERDLPSIERRRAPPELGHDVTDDQGAFDLRYAPDAEGEADKAAAADISFVVTDEAGRRVRILELQIDAQQRDPEAILFNVPPQLKVTLVVDRAALRNLSEYERLLARIGPALRDIPLAELMPEDVAFLAKEVPLSAEDRERVEWMRRAASLVGRTGVPAEAFYGWGRLDLPDRFSALAASQPDAQEDILARLADAGANTRNKILDEAVAQAIIPERIAGMRDGLERSLAQSRPLNRVGTARLLDETDGAPLPNLLVSFGPVGGQPHATVPSDPRGYVPVLAPPGNDAAGSVLAVTVRGAEDAPRLETRLALPLPDEVQELRVPRPAPPAAPAIDAIDAAAKLALPAGLAAALAGRGVRTLADITRRGGLSGLAGLPVADGAPSLRLLEAHADLFRASGDVPASSAVIEAGFDGIAAVAAAPRARFVSALGPKIGDLAAGQIHAVAGAQTALLNNMTLALAAERANGQADPGEAEAVLGPERCECRDCETAVSPLSYLADLAAFVERRVAAKGVPATKDALEAAFHQPFGALPAECGEMDRELRQVRICIEVLRTALGPRPLADGKDEAALATAEATYRAAAHEALLLRLGTSSAEIRLAATADGAARAALAERLQVPLAHLDELRVDPAVPEAEAELESLFGLRDTGKPPLAAEATPKLLPWRRSALREAWRRQDQPEDHYAARRVTAPLAALPAALAGPGQLPKPLSFDAAAQLLACEGEMSRADHAKLAGLAPDPAWQRALRSLFAAARCLPAIDPDLAGPDDLRAPRPGEAAFDLWAKRRDWVDACLAALEVKKVVKDGTELPDFEAMLAEMAKPLDYSGTQLEPWPGAAPDLGALRAALSGPNAEAARFRLDHELHLGEPALGRLLALRGKLAARLADMRAKALSAAEALEVRSILVQAMKARFSEIWRAEEAAAGLRLGPAIFWPGLTEPGQGAWPPEPRPTPALDPLRVADTDLPDPVAGAAAARLLAQRRVQVAAVEAELGNAAETRDFDVLFRAALGDPKPGNKPQHDVDQLRADLGSSVQATADEALRRVTEDLGLRIEDFRRLLAIRAASAAKANAPTAVDWNEAVALLLTARIAKHERGAWREEEGKKPIGPVPYWAALKARLPPWRASPEARAAWQAALRARSATPVLDPDIVVPGDLRTPVQGEATYDLLAAREEALKAERAALTALPETAAGFDSRLVRVLGYGTADLLGIAAARDAGRSVASRLAQLPLDFAAFDVLERVVRLLEAGAAVATAEWDAAHDVLLAAWKRLRSADWLDEERTAGVLLGPEAFLPPAADDAGWSAKPWRAPVTARLAFRDALQARFDADASLAAALSAAVDGVEEAVLPALRDALVAALPLPPGAPGDAAARFEAGAKWVGANLLIDARTGGCAKTTRVAQAIETLQSLVLTLRSGQAGPALSGWSLDAAEHDREWPWMGSYAAWRSAVLVHLYPENLLHPVLLRDRSPALADLLKATAGGPIGREAACAAARDYATYLRDVARMSVQVTCMARTAVPEHGGCNPPTRDERCFFYMFGLGGASGRPYVARYDVQGGGQSWWTPIDEVPGFNSLTALIGAVPYLTSAGKRFIFLIGHREAANQSGLVCATFDLEAGGGLGNWAAGPDLKVPAFDNRRFNAVVKQTDDEQEPPHVVLHDPGGAGTTYKECWLNAEGTGWDGEFRPLGLYSLAGEYRPPVAMIRLRGSDFALVLQGGLVGTYWCYRNPRRDAPERFLGRIEEGYGPTGRFVGAFAWKGIDGVFVLTHDKPATTIKGTAVVAGTELLRFLEPTGQPHVLAPTSFLASPFPFEKEPQLALLAGATSAARFRQVLPGWGATDDSVGKSARFVYRSPSRTEHHRPILIRQDGAPRPSHFIRDDAPLPVLPDVKGALDLPISLSREQRAARRVLQRSAADLIRAYPGWLRAYLDDAWYSARIALGLALHRSREYEAAIDCFRTVFDDTAAPIDRKIYPGLADEEALPETFKRAEDWLRDPLDPHAIAATRRNTRTRFVRIAILRCQLDWADEEFTRDTPESRPIARRLYQDVLDGLASVELFQGMAPGCHEVIGTLDDLVDPRWKRALVTIKSKLRLIGDRASLLKAVGDLKAAINAAGSPAEGVAAALRMAEALPTAPQRNLSQVVSLDEARRAAARRALSASEPVVAAVADLRATVTSEFRRVASVVAGTPQPKLVRDRASLTFLRRATEDQARPLGASQAVLRDMADGEVEDILAPTRLSAFAAVFNQAPQAAMGILAAIPQAVTPAPSLAFCIPPNPVLAALRARAEVNLRKLRTCRNISGLRRAADPYGAPTDAASGLPILGAGGALVLPGLRTLPPTLYRYAALVDRAKQLAQMASQMEGAMLAALERRDAAALAVLKARQDLELAGAGVRLHDLRVTVAQGRASLARLGEKRARVQKDHFAGLLARGESEAEKMAMLLLGNAADLLNDADNYQVIAAVLYFSQVLGGVLAGGITGAAAGGVGMLPGMAVGALTNVSAAASGLSAMAGSRSSRAQVNSTRSSLWSMRATFERRVEEWQFQSELADVDIELAQQQTRNSDDEVSVSQQEREIAGIQQRHARDTLEFLTTKQFGTEALYEWMAGVLQDVYRYFLQQATTTARLAEAQLAFERQEPPPAIVLSDYWRVVEQTAAGGGAEPDRRGQTGSARLLRDITRLDQHAFETRRRKLQLTKTFSLSRVAPVEFQRFRETGVITFATPMELFDRDFPGHYLRLVSRVAVSVVALIPPIHGIRATLSNSGLSRVVIGPDVFQTVPIRREPEQIALSAPMNATGLLELEAQPDMLRPFEGCGVDGVWEFRMPRTSNPFDYRTVADVLLAVDYTALDSPDHRQQVLRALPATSRADAAFSFRNQLPDQWFDLNNPGQTASPMKVGFRLLPEDFPPSLEEPRIEHVALYASRRGTAELMISALLLRGVGAPGAVGGGARTVDGLASTRAGSGASWAGMIGRCPVGEWELTLPDTEEVRRRFGDGEVRDLFLVVSVVGRTPSWPD